MRNLGNYYRELIVLMQKITWVIIAVAVLGIVFNNQASADIRSFNVYAREHSINFNFGGKPLNTGIYLKAASRFRVYSNPKSEWNCGGPCGISNANGIGTGQEYAGYYFNYGALVGRIDNGPYFFLGFNFNGVAPNSGTLYLMQWDCSSGDNSGFIKVTVETKPAHSRSK